VTSGAAGGVESEPLSIAWVIDDIGSAPPVLTSGDVGEVPDDADNLPGIAIPGEG
jgi:hypothetical protein